MAILCAAVVSISAEINTSDTESISADPINLEFSIGDIEFSPSFRFNGISVRCTMLAYASNQLQCTEATLLIRDSPIGPISLAARLTWYPITRRWTVDANGAVGTANKLEFHLDRTGDDTHLLVDLRQFDITLLPRIIGSLVPELAEYDVDSGTLDLKADCQFKASVVTTCDADGELVNLNVNGVNVAENVAMAIAFAYVAGGAGTHLDFNMSLQRGAIYVEPGFTLGGINPGFLVTVTDTPIDVAGRVELMRTGEVRVLGADLLHRGIVEMHFAGDLTVTPSLNWRLLDFSLHAKDVAEFYKTYMLPIALNTAFSSLETAGSVSVNVIGSDDVITDFDLQFGKVYIDDEAGRFSLYDLDGDIKLHSGDEILTSHLNWIGGAVYRINIGPGRIDWESAAGNLKIASWQDVTIFDGEFRMDTLEITDFSTEDAKVVLSGSLSPITLSALTSAFGWLPLSGKLAGTIPRLSYAADRLEMDGDLHVNVFDGDIFIRDLMVDKLFSTLPLLTANISLRQLDLEEITHALSFGNISGRVDGKIADLELQAWRPIHFDAEISTPVDDDSPHRISRQAVDNLGRLGAGTGGALSQGWLRLIPNYSYGRLGLSCRLLNGYCSMGGVQDASDGGFYILTRGGILPPWIGIKGSGRRIKWQTLVDGIKQISAGNWELDVGL